LINYLDLFHGIGGFPLGMYWAGIKVDNHFCSDIEPYAVELYKLRFPDSIQLGDITKINWKKLKKNYPGEWILTGGFPCQDVSIAGKGKGLIDEKTGNKTRSGLWFDYWTGIRILRPKFVIIENVRALLNRGMSTVLENLAEIGYNAEWQDIRASDLYAPHERKRIWIIAYSNNFRNYDEKFFKREGNLGKYINNITPLTWNRIQYERTRENYKNNPDTPPKLWRMDDGVSETMDRLKGLGNAIIPQISELLFNQIKEYL
jgi:DNA (cytosine-5)-methyltransferase 1